MDNILDTAVDLPTPILRALVYQEVLGPYDPVVIAITDNTVSLIEDRLDIIDVAEIPASKYREAYSGKHVIYAPPFTRSLVTIGSIVEKDLSDALLESGYIDKDKNIDDIVDTQAFEAKPVEIKYIDPGNTHLRKLI